MELVYFNKYKIYYDAIKNREDLLSITSSLATECINVQSQLENNLLVSINSSGWSESGRDIAVSILTDGVNSKISELETLIYHNLYEVCNITINKLFPILEEIKNKNVELNEIDLKINKLNELITETLSKIDRCSKYIYDYAELNNPRIIGENEEYTNLMNKLHKYNTYLLEQKEKKSQCTKTLNLLCHNANTYLISIFKLDESLSDKEISDRIPIYIYNDFASFIEIFPEAEAILNKYGPQIQKKFSVVDTNLACIMLMESYISFKMGNRGEEQYGNFENLLDAILNNCPENYQNFDFNPESLTIVELQEKENYNINENFNDKYFALTEIVYVKGYPIEFIEIMPKTGEEYGTITGLPKIEMEFYDIYKANIINFVDEKIPPEVLKNISQDTGIKFVLPYDKEVLLYNGDDVFQNSFYDITTGVICVDPLGTINNNDLYTSNVISYQIGHKLDATHKSFKRSINELGHQIFNGNVDGASYYSQNDEFFDILLDEQFELKLIRDSSITFDDYLGKPEDFFATAFDSYINNNSALSLNCPKTAEVITRMIQ